MSATGAEGFLRFGQIADVTGDGKTFAFEDQPVRNGSNDDYNDIIFRIDGAIGTAVNLDEVIALRNDWRGSKLGQEILKYAASFTQLALVSTSVETAINQALDDLDGATETDQRDFAQLLGASLNSPEALLQIEKVSISDDFREPLEQAANSLSLEIEALPTESSSYFLEDVDAGLPSSLQTVVVAQEAIAAREVAEQEAVFKQSQQAFEATLATIDQPFDEIDQALAEYLMLAESDSGPEVAGVLSEVHALRAAVAEARNELLEELDGTGTVDAILGAIAQFSESLAAESSIIAAPLFVTSNDDGGMATEDGVADFDFPADAHPLIGIIDTGFSQANPHLDFSNFRLGKDYVDDNDSPLLSPNDDDEHGTHVLGIIAATRQPERGIGGINPVAPIWLSRAVGSGRWAWALVDFVNAVIASGRENAIANLSFDLIQVHPDGSESTRYELTDYERHALAYAQQNNVLIVASAGNTGDKPSALGQAALAFDNILTVGAIGLSESGLEAVTHGGTDLADLAIADYSSRGPGVGILALGGSEDYPIYSTMETGLGIMAGTSVSTAKVTGAASLAWAANPKLTYQQIIEVLKQTTWTITSELANPGTPVGLLGTVAAVNRALETVSHPKHRAIDVERPVLSEEALLSDLIERPTFWRKSHWRTVKNVASKVAQVVVKGAEKVATAVVGGVKAIAGAVGGGTKAIVNGAVSLGQKIGSAAVNLVSTLAAAASQVTAFVWNGLKWISRQMWYKLQGIFNSTIHWVRQLPQRVARVFSMLWEAARNLRPWAVSWWTSLANPKTWKTFLQWTGNYIVNIVELLGIREKFDILMDFLFFSSRPLRREEIQIGQGVFGNAIDYSVVRVSEEDWASKWLPSTAIALSTVKRSAMTWANLMFLKNNKDGLSFAQRDVLLVHELVHIWQYQSNSTTDALGMGRGTYAYGGQGSNKAVEVLSELRRNNIGLVGLVKSEELLRNKGMIANEKLGTEAQAEVVEDYYLIRRRKDDKVFSSGGKRDPGNSSYPVQTYNLATKHLPLFTYFVKDASTLSMAELLGVGQGSRSPRAFQSTYLSTGGFPQGIYPRASGNPRAGGIGAYRFANSWIQAFARQDDRPMWMILRDADNRSFWADKIEVPGNAAWVDTGVALQRGEAVAILADGQWTNGGQNQQFVGPDGYRDSLRQDTFLPTAPFAALIGKVGPEIFMVGSQVTRTVSQAGRLYLQMNDIPGTLGDNVDNEGKGRDRITAAVYKPGSNRSISPLI
jgi:subtilisin family serine protease